MTDRVDLGDITLYRGDCLEVIQTLESESVDAVIADPPYNVGKDYGETLDRRKDYREWCEKWITQSFRVTRDIGIVSVKNIVRNLPIMFAEMDKHGDLINQVIWRNVSANHNKRSFWNAYESILIYSADEFYTFNTYAQTQEVSKPSWSKERRERQKNQMRDIWDDIKNVYSGSVNHPEVIHADDGTMKKAHPCQQPIDLPKRIIEFFTKEDYIVLDPFMGSGTTGVACVQTGRRFIGIEIDQKYFDIAVKRIEKAQLQIRMEL